MASDDEFDAFARRLKAQLDQSADELDTLTRARLRAMRLRALAPQVRMSWLRWGVPTALAASLALAVVLSLPPGRDDAVPYGPVAAGPLLAAEDFDLIADADALDLGEDLEFYLWLYAHSGEG